MRTLIWTDTFIKRSITAANFVLLPAGGKRKIASEKQLIKLITGETDEPIKTPPSAAPVRYKQLMLL